MKNSVPTKGEVISIVMTNDEELAISIIEYSRDESYAIKFY